MNPEKLKLDWEIDKIRQDFPILQKKYLSTQDKNFPLVYLDNSATTQKPEYVLNSIQNFFIEHNANIHRSVYKLAESATKLYEDSRKQVADFIQAHSCREIVFTKGTTESINLVAHSWGKKFLRPGEIIILSEAEHHSNLIPWQILSEELQLKLEFIPAFSDGTLDLEKLPALLKKPVGLLAIHHVSNVFGTIQPIEKIVRQCHEHNIPVLIDAAQSIPHILLDVQKIDCDFLVFSGHKMCAPTGIGVLYAKQKWLDQMPPYQGGGEMVRNVWLDHTEYNDPPHRFEAGTPPIAEAVGLSSAISYLKNLGMERIAQYEKELESYTYQKLQEIPFIQVYAPSSQHLGVFSFNLEKIHPHDVAQFLDFRGIAVRAGNHCSQPIMRKLKIPGTVRASLYFYNSTDEIDRLIVALQEMKKFF